MEPRKARRNEFTETEKAPTPAYANEIPRLDKDETKINLEKDILLIPAKITEASAKTGIGRARATAQIPFLSKKFSSHILVLSSNQGKARRDPFPKT